MNGLPDINDTHQDGNSYEPNGNQDGIYDHNGNVSHEVGTYDPSHDQFANVDPATLSNWAESAAAADVVEANNGLLPPLSHNANGNDLTLAQVQAPTGKPKKLPLACHFCRLRKLKCSGGPACDNCIKRSQACTFDDTVRRRGPGKRSKENRDRVVQDQEAMGLRQALQSGNMGAESGSSTLDDAGSKKASRKRKGIMPQEMPKRIHLDDNALAQIHIHSLEHGYEHDLTNGLDHHLIDPSLTGEVDLGVGGLGDMTGGIEPGTLGQVIHQLQQGQQDQQGQQE